MRLTDRIKFRLIDWCPSSAYDIIIPNFYFGRYEMDVFKLTTSAYVIEYEIKVTRVDFFKDVYKGDGDKHERLANGTSKCNRFFYVVPTDLVKVEECPDYAGLLYYDGWGFQVIKNAPLLHKTKQKDADYRKLALKLSFRSHLIERKYRRSVIDRQTVNNQLV